MKCENCKLQNDKRLNFCTVCKHPLNDEAKRLFPELNKLKK